MPFGERSELYFIIAMMFLILVVCTIAVYAFFRTYRKEMREKEIQRLKRKSIGSEIAGDAPDQQ